MKRNMKRDACVEPQSRETNKRVDTKIARVVETWSACRAAYYTSDSTHASRFNAEGDFALARLFVFLDHCVALNFLRVLIFAVFFAIRKYKFPQNKIYSKNYSTVEIIYKNTGLKEKMP